jgi:DNA gyrase subunit B
MPQRLYSPEYDNVKIEILELHEAVRRRPTMYIGSLDQHGLHALLSLTVESLLWHYEFAGLSLNKLAISLEEDGSATLATEGPTPGGLFWGVSAEQLNHEFRRRCLFAAIALCERWHMTLRGPEHQWRSLLFERGVLRSDKLHSVCPPDAGSDVWLRLWPDFSILQPGAFDHQQTLETIRACSEKHPDITMSVSDVRAHLA